MNPKYACVNKLDEKLMKYNDMFFRWCGGKSKVAGNGNKLTAPADKYLARARGVPADEFLGHNQ